MSKWLGVLLVLGMFALLAFGQSPTATERRPFVSSPTGTLPPVGSKLEGSLVPQPWYGSTEIQHGSPQQNTALEPRPGTGLISPIGVTVPPLTVTVPPIPPLSVTHTVSIDPPKDPGTAAQLSRLAGWVEVLLALATAIAAHSAGGRWLPLVVQVVNGLLSGVQASLPVSPVTPPGPPVPLPAGNQAAVYMTPKPGS